MASRQGFLDHAPTNKAGIVVGYQGVALDRELDDSIHSLQEAMRENAGRPPISLGEIEAAVTKLIEDIPADGAAANAAAQTALARLPRGDDAQRAAVLDEVILRLEAIENSLQPLDGVGNIDNQQVYLVVDNILVLLAENGSSGFFTPRGHFFYTDRNGTNCAITIGEALSCLQPNRREFLRAFANRTASLLARDRRHTAWAKLHGIPKDHLRIGFDCAEFVSDLTTDEKRIIALAKAAAISSAPQQETPLDPGFSVRAPLPPPPINANLVLGPR